MIAQSGELLKAYYTSISAVGHVFTGAAKELLSALELDDVLFTLRSGCCLFKSAHSALSKLEERFNPRVVKHIKENGARLWLFRGYLGDQRVDLEDMRAHIRGSTLQRDGEICEFVQGFDFDFFSIEGRHTD